MDKPLKPLALAWLLFPALAAWGQLQTVGTLLNSPESHHGYTLLDPMGTGNTHLINNCGEVVNSWTSDFASGGACYLLEDGSLVRGCRIQGAFSGGGVGGKLERRSWDGDLLWTLNWADDEKHHHHDFAWMPNGHVLVLAWELKTANDAALAGRTNPQTMWPESITEIAPTLPEGGTVVWEWHAWDHLIQDTDEALANHGDPSDHPHRIDVNHANVGGGGGPGGASSGDWMHANAVNYNPQLDQIAISSRRFNEVWVIDHGITSEEAAGPAGDLLYRYGNPEAYGRGDANDQKLFGQHDVQWIPEGHPQAHQLMVYNNGDNRPGCDCSTIDVWEPPLLEDGTYAIDDVEPFGPTVETWVYPESPNTSFFSPNISGVQPLAGGNFLVCQGANGRLFEVTQSGSVVWEYINPEGNFGVSIQGNTPQQNAVFRAYRYDALYPGLADKDLTPGEPLEGLAGFSCELFEEVADGVQAVGNPMVRLAFPNPANHAVTLHAPSSGRWVASNALGQVVWEALAKTSTDQTFDCTTWPEGILFISFENDDRSVRLAQRLFIKH